MDVFEFPPRLSLKIYVNLESLYGINLFYFPIDFSAYNYLQFTSALITFPKTDKDLFILDASLSLNPDVSAFFYLSEPAKSTRFNFDIFIMFYYL